jgi:hypothetical protein
MSSPCISTLATQAAHVLSNTTLHRQEGKHCPAQLQAWAHKNKSSSFHQWLYLGLKAKWQRLNTPCVIRSYAELEVELHSFLTSALDGCNSSTSSSSYLNLIKMLQHPLNKGWMSPRASTDALGKTTISCPSPQSNPNSSATQPTALSPIQPSWQHH